MTAPKSTISKTTSKSPARTPGAKVPRTNRRPALQKAALQKGGADAAVEAPWAMRPHQVDAVDAACSVLGTGGTALVVMATGTGKTLVGLHVAERLGAGTVAILVPSLALADQIGDHWRAACGPAWADASWLVVCSGDEDSSRSTDPATIAAHLTGSGAGPKVVIATYHSSPKLAAAQRRGAPPFDLVVADEAHHLAGPPPGPFGTLARGEIGARARLLMTATPRSFSTRRGELTQVGLDDAAVFGARVYDLRLGAAIEAGILSDYQVVLATVDAAELARVQADLPGDCDSGLVASAVALCESMARFGLRRVVSFHSRTGRATAFAELVAAAAATLEPSRRPPGRGWAAALTGRTTATRRHELLERLAHGAQDWSVVANCQVLGEGVDIPALDAVALCDPKASDVDIAQAVGRVLRTHGDKHIGTIVIPVVLDGSTPVGRGLAVAGAALRALRSHDERLGAALDELRRDRARLTVPSGRTAHRDVIDRVKIVLPDGLANEIADAVLFTVTGAATSSFDEWYGLLEDWVVTHHSAAVPQSATVAAADGTRRALGSWCSVLRRRHRQGSLLVEHEAALEALPGWCWEPVDERFAAQLAALVAWSDQTGNPVGSCPTRTVHDGVRVGQFCNVVRGAYHNGSLPAHKVEALESLAGWCWNVPDARWSANFALLERYAAEHGHACPSYDDVVEGVNLGRWVTKQRIKVRAGTLDGERSMALRALAGWLDHEREDPWWRLHATLVRYVAAHGALPSQSVRYDNVRLGNWVAKQRSRHRDGRLEADRIAALESVPHWSWAPGHKRFERGLACLDEFVAAHGHARVPDDYVSAEGFPLGSWVGTRRAERRRGALAPERVTMLSQRPGWCWNGHDVRFAESCARLERFVAAHGRLPGTAECFEDVRVGLWVKNRRDDFRLGKLSAARCARLEAVPLWRWTSGPGEAPITTRVA